MHQIRLAKLEDIIRIAQIEQQCFPETEAATLQSFNERFSVFPECFFVLEVSGEVVGHINGCIYDSPVLPDKLYSDPSLHCPDGGYQTVFGLAVDPNHQNRGYASFLTQHFIQESKTNSRLGLVLTCKDYLIHFYEKHGFRCHGKSESTHGGSAWNDMILLF